MSIPICLCNSCSFRLECDVADDRIRCERYKKASNPKSSTDIYCEFLLNRIIELDRQLTKAQKSQFVCHFCQVPKLEARILELEQENKRLRELFCPVPPDNRLIKDADVKLPPRKDKF